MPIYDSSQLSLSNDYIRIEHYCLRAGFSKDLILDGEGRGCGEVRRREIEMSLVSIF